MYDKLSKERKDMQARGEIPSWFSTGSWQMFKTKYLYGAATAREQYQRIADTAAKHLPDGINGRSQKEVTEEFFNLLWNGWLSPSTPVLSNMGTDRGLPVSCAGSYVPDSIDGIYSARRETAMLTKMGFGTAGYVGDIRPRGSSIKGGGTSYGVLPVMEGFWSDMDYVAQGSARRGSWAGYLPITHGDFYEVCNRLFAEPNGRNVGWCVSNDDLRGLATGDPDITERYQEAMKTKMTTGKGYWFFPDKANDHRPETYVHHGLKVTAPQLCNEITLFNDDEHTYTCVLASMNASRYDEWHDTDACYWATVFLDCVVSEFLSLAQDIPGLEKAVRCTEKGRALGLGVMGYQTYLLDHMIPFDSFDAHLFNEELFFGIRTLAEKATKDMAELLGEPEWCKGFGRRNTHLLSVAPTKSTSVMMGGVSEGISPIGAFVFTQRTPAGEINRIDPSLLSLMKRKGVYDIETVEEIRDRNGSVQHVDWLDDREKAVFKTAFELDQHAIIREASHRSKWIDQWQSLNLFFAADESEDVINDVHAHAFFDPNILGLYYVNSSRNPLGKREEECEACQ